jgi:erythromycin esterase
MNRTVVRDFIQIRFYLKKGSFMKNLTLSKGRKPLIGFLPFIIFVFLTALCPQPGKASDPCTEARVLKPGEYVRAVLGKAVTDCYLIELGADEYVKVVVEGIGTSAAAELWLPGTTKQNSWPYTKGEIRGSSQILTAVAGMDGTHSLIVGPIVDGGPPLPYRIEFMELLTADQYQERLEQSRSDPRVTWLQENALPIRSLDPGDDDFSDLRAFGEIIAGVDVVMLGEASHHDAPTYHAKTRLIKFLHQEMGFDVIVFENDLYKTWKMWEGIKAGELDRKWMYGMYNVVEFQPLLEYIREQASTERPLIMAGMDPHTLWAAEQWIPDLDAFLGTVKITTENEPSWQQVRTTMMEAYQAMGDTGLLPRDYISAGEVSVFAEQVATLEEVIRTASPHDPMASFWNQTLSNAPEMLDWLRSLAEVNNDLYTEIENLNRCKRKDAQMAANLVWLAREHFAGRKIIVWSHNFHIFRNPHTISTPGVMDAWARCVQYTRLDEFTTMGHDVYQALGERVYTMGVISYEGNLRSWDNLTGWEPKGSRPINRSEVEALELKELFFLAGHDQAFLDMRSLGKGGAWLHERLDDGWQARWPAVLDGFLFIRETYRTQPAKSKEQ